MLYEGPKKFFHHRLGYASLFQFSICLLFALAFQTHAATTRVWSGGGADNFWTTAANWTNNSPPVAGDDLVFPPGVARLSASNNFPAGTLFNSITISGTNYALGGSNIVLSAGVNATNTTAQNFFYIPLTLNSNQTITSGNSGVNFNVNGDIALNGKNLIFTGNGILQVQGALSGAGNLIKTGTGNASLYANNTFSGTLQIVQGDVSTYNSNALGSAAAATTISSGAILNFTGNASNNIAEPLVLQGTISTFNAGTILTGPVTLAAANATVQAPNSDGPLTVNAVISGSGGFTKNSAQVLTLNSNNTYTGTTTVSNGTLRVNGSQPASPILFLGGTLSGTGTVGTITASGPAVKTLNPGGSGPGIFNAGYITFDTNTVFGVELNGTTAGVGYDQLNVTGGINLANAALFISLGFVPAVSNSFTVINNDGTDPIVGTFAGLPEGAIFPVGTNAFQITYAGGSGNDVVLINTGLPAPVVMRIWDGGGANNLWTNPTNWVGDVVPNAGDDLLFPPGAARLINQNNFPTNTVFNSITLGGPNYDLSGNPIMLKAGINSTNTTGFSSVSMPLVLAANQTFTAAGSNSAGQVGLNGDINTAGHLLTFSGTSGWQVQSAISGAGGLNKTGACSVLLYASNSFSGGVEIFQGSVSVYDDHALGTNNAVGTIVYAGSTLTLANTPRTIPNSIALLGTLLSGGQGPNTLTGAIALSGGNAAIQVNSPLIINGLISGSDGFTLLCTNAAPETLTLNANNPYTGTTTVSNGTLVVNGVQPRSPIVLSGGTLGGTGVVGTITTLGAAPKIVSPGSSAGILNSSNVTFDASTTFLVELNSTTPGSGYDQLNVTGSVNLAGCILSNSVGFSPAIGQAFTIINNDGSDAITGTFSGLPQGAVFTNAGAVFLISYNGGSGNDVVLTRVPAPQQLVISVLTNGSKQVQGLGLSNATYTIQGATNLIPVIVWSNLGVATADNIGLFSFTDPNAPLFPQRFYRALSP